MYIALKWLLSLNFVLWFGLCISDIFNEKVKDINISEWNSNAIEIKTNLNMKLKTNKEEPYRKRTSDTLLFYSVSFVMAGLFSLYFKRNRFIWRENFYYGYIHLYFHPYILYIQESANYMFTKSLNYIKVLELLFMQFWKKFCLSLNFVKEMALKKLKESKEEIMKTNENKTKCNWEAMTNNSFALYAKHINKNIFQYLSYQQLYLISHQENIFLKSRLEKMLQEKKNVEKNLLSIVNQVYLSKNNELKAYCSKFVVLTKDNLLKSDVKVEVQKFIENYNFPKSKSGTNILQISKSTCNKNYTQPNNGMALDMNNTNFIQSPKGYVWTIKDKNGMIKKLFEYETDINNAKCLRRIREYSVYYIKESFINHHRILSDLQSNNNGYTFQRQQACTLANHNFLTSSHVFRSFLKNNPTFMIKDKRKQLLLEL